MRAAVQTALGEPAEVLKVVDLPNPEPGPGEVLLEVSRATVGLGDLLGIRRTPAIPATPGYIRRGSHSVGLIRALGADVAGQGRLHVGDRVIGFPASGSWAERVIIPAAAAVPVPSEVGDDFAPQLLISYSTALSVLMGLRASVTADALRAGAVLVTGAGTTVARILLYLLGQEGIRPIGLARSLMTARRVASELANVEVAATDDPDWPARVKALAADRAIIGVLDCVAGPLIARLLPLVANEAAIVTYGGLGGLQLTLGPVELVTRQLVARGAVYSQWLRQVSDEERAEDVDAAFRLAVEMPVLVKPSSIHALSDIKQAVKAVDQSGRDGFVLVRP